jgi:hypothetical protein
MQIAKREEEEAARRALEEQQAREAQKDGRKTKMR